jgi:WD40 repeat protein
MKHIVASTVNRTADLYAPVFVWRLADEKELYRLDHNSRFAWATDKQVTTVGRLSDIRTWNISTGKSVKKTPFAGCYYRGSVSSNGKLVAYTDKTIGASIYDLSRRANVWRHPSNRDTVYSVDISSDGSLVAFGGRQGFARVYTVKGNKLLAEFRHGNYVQGVALSPDKKRLVTCSWDSKVRWFDLQAKKLIREHSASAPMSAAVSPDGSRYAAGGNGVVLVWDAKSGRELARFSAHGGTIVTALSFSKDGEMVVSGGRDRNVSVWKIN